MQFFYFVMIYHIFLDQQRQWYIQGQADLLCKRNFKRNWIYKTGAYNKMVGLFPVKNFKEDSNRVICQ